MHRREEEILQKKRMQSGVFDDLMSIGTLYSFLFSMMASGVLLSLPLLGGALYLLGRVSLVLLRYRRGLHSDLLPPSMKKAGTILMVSMLFCLAAMITACTVRLESAALWRLFGLVLFVLLRQAILPYVAEKCEIEEKSLFGKILRLSLVQALFLLPLLLILLPGDFSARLSLSLAAGYFTSGLLQCFSLRKNFISPRPFSDEEKEKARALEGVHAYKVFHRVLLISVAAVQLTQVLTYTYIASTADALILCMAIALFCTYAAETAAKALMKRPLSRGTDPSFLIMGGLAIWLYGLILFSRCLDHPGTVNGYISLALCTGGATVSLRMLGGMGEDMRRVAAFGTGQDMGKDMKRLLEAQTDLSALLGQMTALIGLMLICVFTGPDYYGNGELLFQSFSPLLTLPAFLTVGIALGFAVAFPLTKRHLEKLRRYMLLQEQGQENASLQKELENVVVRRSLKKYGVRVLLALARPFYYHRIQCRENVHLDEDIPCVFVCNHGEIYGPIVTNLYVPFFFRPWSTYEMLNVEAVAERTLDGTMKDQKIVPPGLARWFMYKIGGPLLGWVMRSVECIPVYHDNPRMLRQTFRETLAAMETGDHILIFPENAETEADHKYVKEGVSEFFTGFTMVGQLYYNKTGKCPQFVPLYADKRRRTITFGIPTRYNPDAPSNEEKERLCTYLRGEMLRMAGLKEN